MRGVQEPACGYAFSFRRSIEGGMNESQVRGVQEHVSVEVPNPHCVTLARLAVGVQWPEPKRAQQAQMCM